MRQNQTLTEGGFSVDMSVSRDSRMLDVSKREMNIRMVRLNHEYWNRNSNFMSSLPSGVFNGLTRLTYLDLTLNPHFTPTPSHSLSHVL